MKNQILLGFITVLLTSCLMPEMENPADPQSKNFASKSQASIKIIDSTAMILGNDILLEGGISSPSVENAGLVKEYHWDMDGNGIYELIRNKKDTLPIKLANDGARRVNLKLIDQNYDTSTTSKMISVYQASKWNGFPKWCCDSICPFYAQNEYTMRGLILLSQFLTYQNKTESLNLGAFVFELLKNLVGTVNPLTFIKPFQTDYQDGVYTFKNEDFSINGQFHYGAGNDKHAENEIIAHNLFSPTSYIKSLKPSLKAPFYSYEKGPLFDLIEDVSFDISNKLQPKVTYNIDFANIKFSCNRTIEDRYSMSSELTQDGLQSAWLQQFLFNYKGKATIHPFALKNLISLVGKDSLAIDLSGSELFTDTLPIPIVTQIGSHKDTLFFNMQLIQNMIRQKAYFGTSDGKNKVLGNYFAKTNLTGQGFELTESFFEGAFSISELDTATFYCDSLKTYPFGQAQFGLPSPNQLTFKSERYNYNFTMSQSLVSKLYGE